MVFDHTCQKHLISIEYIDMNRVHDTHVEFDERKFEDLHPHLSRAEAAVAEGFTTVEPIISTVVSFGKTAVESLKNLVNTRN